MMARLGVCGLASWIVGIVVGIWAYVAVNELTFWLPALLIGVALAAFIGLVLGGLACGLFKAGDAGHGADHAHAGDGAAVGIEALAEAEAGALEAGARAAGIDPAEAAREKEMLDARINAARAEATQAGGDAEDDMAEAAAEAAATGTGTGTATGTTTGTGSALADELLAEAEAGDRDAGADALAEAAQGATSADAGIGTTPDFDGDGVQEGTDEGTKPATMRAARDGGPDNLKEIKGVGPKLEALLHEMGFFHFDQIASWGAAEVAWVDANLKGFKGRVSRDNWVDQAKILAAGGETEFSSRVDKGEVY